MTDARTARDEVYADPTSSSGAREAADQALAIAECPNASYHGRVFRYCHCGWIEPPPAPRTFVLERVTDVTGVSGTGTVAEGIQFSDGHVALRWIVGSHRSTVIWASIDSVIAVHGHDGATQVRWTGDEPTGS